MVVTENVVRQFGGAALWVVERIDPQYEMCAFNFFSVSDVRAMVSGLRAVCKQ